MPVQPAPVVVESSPTLVQPVSVIDIPPTSLVTPVQPAPVSTESAQPIITLTAPAIIA
jgi:hypothetical protein